MVFLVPLSLPCSAAFEAAAALAALNAKPAFEFLEDWETFLALTLRAAFLALTFLEDFFFFFFFFFEGEGEGEGFADLLRLLFRDFELTFTQEGLNPRNLPAMLPESRGVLDHVRYLSKPKVKQPLDEIL